MRNCYKYRGGIGVFDKDGKSIFDRDVNTLANNQIYLPTKSELNGHSCKYPWLKFVV